MARGIDTILTGPFGLPPQSLFRQPVVDWLREGARFEDEGTCHATQHFHNPMKSFTESGVSDLHFGALLWWIPPPLPPAPPISPDQLVRVAMRPFCLMQIRQYLPDVTAIHSAVRWGTRYTDPTTKGADIGNLNDWEAVRAAYKQALLAPRQAARESWFARTFWRLGHVLHLVQDMAVPAHARDDFQSHLQSCENFLDVLNGSVKITDECGDQFERFMRRRGDLVDQAGTVTVPFANHHVTRFWDVGRYRFGQTPATDLNQGLAEYTNSNFISNSARLMEHSAPRYRFPYPRESSTNFQDAQAGRLTVTCQAADGGNDQARYISRTDTTPGEPITHFLRVNYHADHTIGSTPPEMRSFTTSFDDCVHTDYAAKLIPRAIGYSVGLLDYFFRGRLRVVQFVPATESAGVDQIVWQPDDRGPDIDRVTVWLLNASRAGDLPERIVPDPETGLAGSLTILARYRDGTGGGGEERNTTFVLKDPTTFRNLPHVDDGVPALPLQFVLAPGQDPIRTREVSQLEYTIVWEGQLGVEKNAIIGRVLPGPLLYEVTPLAAGLGQDVVGRGNGIDASTSLDFYHIFGYPLFETPQRERTAETIRVSVPDAIGVSRPGRGGAVMIRGVSADRESVSSNPVPFTPLADGLLVNGRTTPLSATIFSVGPILPGGQVSTPGPWTVNLGAGETRPFTLPAGFLYETVPATRRYRIDNLIPNVPDFQIVFPREP